MKAWVTAAFFGLLSVAIASQASFQTDPLDLFTVSYKGIGEDPRDKSQAAVYELTYSGEVAVDAAVVMGLVDDSSGNLISSATLHDDSGPLAWVRPGKSVTFYLPLNDDQKSRFEAINPDGSELTLVFSRFQLFGDDVLDIQSRLFSAEFKQVETDAEGKEYGIFAVTYGGDRNIDDISVDVALFYKGRSLTSMRVTESVRGAEWLASGGTRTLRMPLANSLGARNLLKRAPQQAEIRFRVNSINFMGS